MLCGDALIYSTRISLSFVPVIHLEYGSNSSSSDASVLG